MLSYQHAYHAGNVADVHKHVALVLLLNKLREKASPFCFVDAHAGRGVYDLEGEAARKTGEAEGGVLRLAAAASTVAVATAAAGAAAPPPGVQDYLHLISAFNEPGRLCSYPGSAALARAMLREQDRAILLELHPQEVAALRASMGGDRRIAVHARDCYEGLPALLPPPIRRGLVLIDPSYEIKDEYERVVRLVEKALARFGNGIYLLWYPLLAEARHRFLLRQLTRLGPPKTLVSEFRLDDAAAGLRGSGLVVINAPWRFDAELATAIAYLVAALGSGSAAQEQHWLG